MKIISFNINGLRARVHQLEALIAKHDPDVIGLQEIKVADEDFPYALVEHLGYHIFHFGQKGHYGVALLTKKQPLAVRKGFDGDDDMSQKRMIMADIATEQGVITVMNGYFPQGENRKHETKFPLKEKFYQDLQIHLERYHSSCDNIIVMGDINISPTDRDIGIGEHNRKRWLQTGKCSFLPEEREWLARLQGFGFFDTFREQHPLVDDKFSWFDYRSKGIEDNRGLRIDVILATKSLMEKLTDTGIDLQIRRMDKPSDHSPIWATFG